MTRWSAITRTRGRRSALAYGSRSTTAAEDNLNRLVHHERGRYSIAFSVFPEREGTRVKTETRTVGTSAEATRLFRRYWLVIRPGSDAIRRSWLAAIRRHALRALATTSESTSTHWRSRSRPRGEFWRLP